jgi:hypothetical protein
VRGRARWVITGAGHHGLAGTRRSDEQSEVVGMNIAYGGELAVALCGDLPAPMLQPVPFSQLNGLRARGPDRPGIKCARGIMTSPASPVTRHASIREGGGLRS